MKFWRPFALCSCLVFAGCTVAPVEQSSSSRLELEVSCKVPRNDIEQYDPVPETVFGMTEDLWPGTHSSSCYGPFSTAAYCNADQTDCSLALVNNTINYQVDPVGEGQYRVHGTLVSEYGASVRIESSLGGMTTRTSAKFPEGTKIIDSGGQSSVFDVTLQPGEEYFIAGFADSGVTFSLNRLSF